MQTIDIPVKINDTIYYLASVFYLDDPQTHAYHYEKEIFEYRVRSIHISCNAKGIWKKSFRAFKVIENKVIDSSVDISFEELNSAEGLAFYDLSAAEKRLAEIRGTNDRV